MKLRIIGLIGVLAFGLLAASLPAEAQQAGKVYRIGFLRTGSGSPITSPVGIAFRQRLRELGYVEGQNLVIEYRSTEGKRERRPEIAAELVRLKVDVIVTQGGSPGLIRAAQRATHTIPIVMTGSHVDPVEVGLVVSLARPGGNITGLTNLAAKLHAKQLELLKEAFPRISRVAILWPRSHQHHAMKEVEAVGQALGIQIQSLVVTGRRLISLESAFSAITRERSDGLLVVTTSSTLGPRARIIEFTANRRLPTIYDNSLFVDAGGLMSYGTDFQHLYRRVATYVDKILKGAKPGDLPVEQPRKFDLVINLKKAKELGLTIPPQFLARANKVIK
ncbi:MAG: ABC transporter substrate-binding protein [Gammaproteobacteria bacterium]